MLRYKTTVAVIAMCAIGLIGIGAGWLLRGRVRDEAPLRAVEQPGKQPKSDESVPDSRQAQRDELEYRLNVLDKREREREDRRAEERNQTRLALAEARDTLRLREREIDLDREERQVVLKSIMLRISVLQKQLQSIDDKTEAGSNERKKVKNLLAEEEEKLRREKDWIRKQESADAEILRPLRMGVYRAEEALRLLEDVQAQLREEHASVRQSLRARILRLEEAN